MCHSTSPEEIGYVLVFKGDVPNDDVRVNVVVDCVHSALL